MEEQNVQQPQQSDKLVRFSELAGEMRAFGVPASWLKKEAEKGKLPALKIGNRRVFSVNAVKDHLLQRASKQ